MRSNIFNIFAALTLASIALFGSNAIAQDATRSLNDFSSISIIRDIDDNAQLCYSYWERGTFYRISDNNPMSTFMTISDPSVIIHDFEIMDDTVFFCGQYEDKAIAGYFDLLTFPATDVWYFIVDENKALIKLDVYREGDELRMEMISRKDPITYRNVNTLVEARRTAGVNWGYTVMDTVKKMYSFDDVKVTKTCVMFTGRGADEKDSTIAVSAGLWVFPKPTYGFSLFQNYADISMIPIKPTSKSLIEQSDEDTVAVAFNIIGDMVVSNLFDATNYIGSCNIYPVESPNHIKDIKYSTDEMDFNILTGGDKEDVFNGIVYTVPVINHLYSGGISYRSISGYEVQSLTYIDANPFNFAASGHDNTSTLHVHRFDQQAPTDCIPIFDYESDAVGYEINKEEIGRNEKSRTATLYKLETFHGTLEITTICEE